MIIILDTFGSKHHGYIADVAICKPEQYHKRDVECVGFENYFSLAIPNWDIWKHEQWY